MRFDSDSKVATLKRPFSVLHVFFKKGNVPQDVSDSFVGISLVCDWSLEGWGAVYPGCISLLTLPLIKDHGPGSFTNRNLVFEGCKSKSKVLVELVSDVAFFSWLKVRLFSMSIMAFHLQVAKLPRLTLKLWSSCFSLLSSLNNRHMWTCLTLSLSL